MTRKVPRTKAGKARKMSKVMHEFGAGSLHIGRSNKRVRSRKQAVAIGLSMTGKSRRSRRAK